MRALRREQYQSDEETEYLTEDLQIAAVGKGSSDSRKTEKSASPVAEKPKSPPKERSGKGWKADPPSQTTDTRQMWNNWDNSNWVSSTTANAKGGRGHQPWENQGSTWGGWGTPRSYPSTGSKGKGRGRDHGRGKGEKGKRGSWTPLTPLESPQTPMPTPAPPPENA